MSPKYMRQEINNGMKPEEFVTYGGFRDTLTTFIAGYDDLCKLIRGYMI